MTRCHFCQREIDPDARSTHQRVIGWHRPGKAGGSDISLRELLPEFAHHSCITLARSQKKARITPGQMSFE